MRKLESIRKMAKKITGINDIYHLDVGAFALKGDTDVQALPFMNNNGNADDISIMRHTTEMPYFETFEVRFPKLKEAYASFKVYTRSNIFSILFL